MSEVRIIALSDIGKCPKHSLLPGHYNDDGSCKCDPTEAARRKMVDTGEPYADLADVQEHGEQTWSTDELQEEFEVLGFQAPFVVVRRKSDGVKGSLEFTHSPRVYFGWTEDK